MLIPLNGKQEAEIKRWAADDRLWTTQETVEFNLRWFARKMLAGQNSSSIDQVMSALSDAFPSPRTSRDCVTEKNLRDILSARVGVQAGSDSNLLAERED